MHFDFIAEGWEPDLRAFEKYLDSRTFSIPMKHKDGSIIIEQVPGALRPRRAYTYVFPKEHLHAVLNSLKHRDYVSCVDDKGTAILGYTAAAMRTMLRLKKIPKPDISKGSFPLVMNNIRVLGLGIREDIDTTQNGMTYEGL